MCRRPPRATPATGRTGGCGCACSDGAPERQSPGSLIRMNVDMVLVPITVTDPMNRLVTGLEQEDFQVYENNGRAEDSQLCQRGCAGLDRDYFRPFGFDERRS